MFCLGDLVHSNAKLQEQLAGVAVSTAAAAASAAAAAVRPSFLPGRSGAVPAPQALVPVLRAVLQVALRAADELERSAALHLLQAFAADNPLGQMALLASVKATGV